MATDVIPEEEAGVERWGMALESSNEGEAEAKVAERAEKNAEQNISEETKIDNAP